MIDRHRWTLVSISLLLIVMLIWWPVAPVSSQPAAVENNNNLQGLHTDPATTNRYHNLGATLGDAGFGIRENAGAVQAKNDGGAWVALVPGGAGPAPSDATYITQTANATLTAEQALDALATGIMRVDTAAGVVTSLTDSAGIAANISDEIGSGPLTFGVRQIEVVIVSKTTTLAESGEIYTNTGDADGSTATLLNDPTIGANWTWIAMEAQTITISPSAGETIEADGSVCADVRIGAAVGESLTLVAAEGGAGGVFTPIASHGGFTCTP